jgi:hypothetical protein
MIVFPYDALFWYRLGELAKQVAPSKPIRFLGFHTILFAIPYDHQVIGWGNVYVLTKIPGRQKIVAFGITAHSPPHVSIKDGGVLDHAAISS